MKAIFKPFRLALLVLSASAYCQPGPDSVWVTDDTVSYICSFDGILLDGIPRKKIFKPRDNELVQLVTNIEKDVRVIPYLKTYEAGFISTAGVTWRSNDQILLYNPEKIYALRKRYQSGDSLNMLLKGLILHEIGHHLLPHAVKRLIRKVPTDTIKIFEMEADIFMGQALRRYYNLTKRQVEFVMDRLVSETSLVESHSSKKDRISFVLEGWKRGGFTYAKHSPLYKTFIGLQLESMTGTEKRFAKRMARDGEYVIAHTWSHANEIESDTAINHIGNLNASFSVVRENGRKYLELDAADNSNGSHRLGVVTDFDSDPFKYIVYDEYYTYWFITKENDAYAESDGQYYFVGKVNK